MKDLFAKKHRKKKQAMHFFYTFTFGKQYLYNTKIKRL